jgi:hypothetical protein
VWEEVEARTNEQVELSGVYLAFMALAGLLAMVGIYRDSAILIVGAMVVGPESGALIGVLIGVTTIPAAANVGVAAACQDWSTLRGSGEQLAIKPRHDRARRHGRPLYPAAPPPAPQGERGPQTEEPSDDQISTFVRTFSTTASVNSVVVAWPPRSNVLTPPAVVSSVAS